MKTSKVGIDFAKVDKARNAAGAIAEDVQSFVDRYTTVTVERTLCRFVGIDGVDEHDVPLPNVVVTHLKEQEALSDGVFFYLATQCWLRAWIHSRLLRGWLVTRST